MTAVILTVADWFLTKFLYLLSSDCRLWSFILKQTPTAILFFLIVFQFPFQCILKFTIWPTLELTWPLLYELILNPCTSNSWCCHMTMPGDLNSSFFVDLMLNPHIMFNTHTSNACGVMFVCNHRSRDVVTYPFMAAVIKTFKKQRDVIHVCESASVKLPERLDGLSSSPLMPSLSDCSNMTWE